MPVAVMHTDDTATAEAQSARGAKTDPASDATLSDPQVSKCRYSHIKLRTRRVAIRG
jgi:hypothetical protein